MGCFVVVVFFTVTNLPLSVSAFLQGREGGGEKTVTVSSVAAARGGVARRKNMRHIKRLSIKMKPIKDNRHDRHIKILLLS